jgi:hypothetical protein
VEKFLKLNKVDDTSVCPFDIKNHKSLINNKNENQFFLNQEHEILKLNNKENYINNNSVNYV